MCTSEFKPLFRILGRMIRTPYQYAAEFSPRFFMDLSPKSDTLAAIYNSMKTLRILLYFALAALSFAGVSKADSSGFVSKDNPKYSEEIFAESAKDFVFSAKFHTENGGKALLKFHSDKNGSKGYAVCIDNDIQSPRWWTSTGSLLNVRNIAKKFARDGEWFDLKVKVHGAEILVWVNGLLVAEYVEPENIFRTPENASMRLSEGVFYLEHAGGGKVAFSNATLSKLPPRADIDNQRANAIDETSDKVIRLHQRCFPVMDFHVHLKGGFTADWAFAKSRKIGINYAIAPNCGRDFQLNCAPKAADYLANTAKDLPFISCMQAEGREWYRLFPAEIRKGFAYAFTDAMTFDDLNGKRTHIWKKEEVDCPKGSEQAYMDLIVKTICNLIENEPADIYANPLRMPEFMEKDFNLYWTKERRNLVLDSLAKSGKALEINMICRLPDFEFIKEAKARGVKFTFGSNNASPEFGRFEYAFEAIENCGLQPSDIFNPYTAKISKK